MAQTVDSSIPIIVNLKEIDRSAVTLLFLDGTNKTATLGIPYNALNLSNKCMIVSNALTLKKTILIMDGEKLIAKGTPVAGFGSASDPWSRNVDEMGFALRFESPEEAKRVNAILRIDRNVDELMQYYKKHRLDNKSSDIYF